MQENTIEKRLPEDLALFLHLKAQTQDTVTIEDALTIGAQVAARYLRLIFNQNKEVTPEELNGVFGLVSNYYAEIFEGQLQQEDYLNMSAQSKALLESTDFDAQSQAFFDDLVSKKTNPS